MTGLINCIIRPVINLRLLEKIANKIELAFLIYSIRTIYDKLSRCL